MKSRISNALAALPLVATALALGEPAGAAQTDVVLVSASRSQTSVGDMPLHTTVIAQEQIERSPAQSLDQLLRSVPGLNFTGIPAAGSDPTGHQTRMRGLGNAKVLVLLDGVPAHDPFYLTTQWFKLPLANIERVEIVRGGGSSLWGNMATAGVVNIVSRRARDNEGQATLSFGTQGTGSLALTKNFALSDALGFNLAVDRFQTDGYQTTPAADLWRYPAKGPVAARNSNAAFTAWFAPARDLQAHLRLGHHVQDQDISYRFGRNRQASPDLAASLTRQFDTRASLTANAWAQNVAFEKYNGAACYWQTAGTKCPSSAALTPANVNGNIVEYYSQYGSQRYSERGGSVAYSTLLGGPWRSFQLGADYRKLEASDLEYFYAAPTVLGAWQNFNSSTRGRGRQSFTGLFVQTKLALREALELTLSGRYDGWANSDRSNTRTTAAGITSGGAIEASRKSALSPSLSARYQANDRVAIRGAAYQAFRAPGFNNITRTYGTGTATTIANPDLAPETLKGWELGSDYRGGALSLGATYYHYDIKSMIATYTVRAASANIPAQVTTICGAVAAGGFSNCGSAATVNYYTNDQDGQSHGLELTGRWAVRPALTLEASLSHTETTLTRRGSVVTDPLGVQLAAVPREVASLSAAWKPDDRLRGYAELRYIGPMLIDTTSVAGTQFAQGGVAVVNASASYAWSRGGELFASVLNLLDREYSEHAYRYNQPYSRNLSQTRSVHLGVKLRF